MVLKDYVKVVLASHITRHQPSLDSMTIFLTHIFLWVCIGGAPGVVTIVFRSFNFRGSCVQSWIPIQLCNIYCLVVVIFRF